MSVKLVPYVCPNCGGQVQIPEGTTTCFCTFCGTQIAVDDGSQTFHVHTYDEAEIRRLEFEEERERKEFERSERELRAYEDRHRVWRRCVLGWVIAIVVLLALTTIGETAFPSANETITVVAGGVLVLGPIVLVVLRPRRPRRRR